MDYVVESYVSGTSWYRKYKSGWIEQGGRVSQSSSSVTVSLLKEMANTNYNIQATRGNTTTGHIGSSNWGEEVHSKTVSSFVIWSDAANANRVFYWLVSGQGA